MTWTEPHEFAGGEVVTAANLNIIGDSLLYVGQTAQVSDVSNSSVGLTQEDFITVATVVIAEDGWHLCTGSVRIGASRGNKELRVVMNADYTDALPWPGAQNQFGVATEAFSSLSVSRIFEAVAGDTIDLGVYVDTPDAVLCEYAGLQVAWLRAPD